MARNINTVVLNGHLTADALINANGTVAKYVLAVNDYEKNAEGKYEEKVDFIDCKCFQKGIFQYLKKGSEVSVTGRLKQEKWESKDGQKRSRLIVNVSETILGDAPKAKDETPAAAEENPEA